MLLVKFFLVVGVPFPQYTFKRIQGGLFITT